MQPIKVGERLGRTGETRRPRANGAWPVTQNMESEVILLLDQGRKEHCKSTIYAANPLYTAFGCPTPSHAAPHVLKSCFIARWITPTYTPRTILAVYRTKPASLVLEINQYSWLPPVWVSNLPPGAMKFVSGRPCSLAAEHRAMVGELHGISTLLLRCSKQLVLTFSI